MQTYIVKITTVVKTEVTYFFTEIPKNARRVITSNIFQMISSPLLSLFISAFIWTTTHSFLTIAAFNIGRYAFHPVAFYISGLLLRRINIKTMFAVGAVSGGLATLLIVSFHAKSPWAYLTFGIIYGVGYGFYWANRNYLELQETIAEGRKYFYSLVHIIGSVSSVAVPIVAGWFIAFGRNLGWYSAAQAYWLIFAISFLLLSFAGAVIYWGTFESPVPVVVSRFGSSSVWNKRRLLAISGGAIDGLSFLPTLLILTILGNEGVLGTVSGIVALVTIVTTYAYGRKFDLKNQYKVLIGSSLILAAGPLALALNPGPAVLIFLIIALSLGSTFFVLAYDPLSLFYAEEEMAGDTSLRYSFIVDNETFLNTGRLLALVIGLYLYFLCSEKTVLIWGPLAAAGLQILFMVLFFTKRWQEKVL